MNKKNLLVVLFTATADALDLQQEVDQDEILLQQAGNLTLLSWDYFAATSAPGGYSYSINAPDMT